MIKVDTITQTMKMHHHIIEGLANRFTKRQFEPEVFPNLFNQLKWEIEKHFFLEERAIFTFIDTDDLELFETSEKLIKEHRKILEYLKAEKIVGTKSAFVDAIVAMGYSKTDVETQIDTLKSNNKIQYSRSAPRGWSLVE